MFGSHLSIAGGMHNALTAAVELNMDCVQVFTANQRQWTPKPPTEENIALWHEHRKTTGMDHVVSHDSYLINLASPKDDGWAKSIALLRSELERCEMLDIPHVVTHPGAHVGEGEAYGLKRIAEAFDQLHKELAGYKVVTCLEVTAGQGTTLGYKFEHLRQIIDTVKDPQRLAVCLDTAHMIAAGYDLTSAKGAKAVLAELDEVIGMAQVKVVHVNDSKTAMGSRVDRHEHIGHGHVSLDAFKVLVNDPHLASVPKILETAKDDHPDGEPWDTVNIRTLKSLQTATTRRKRKNP